MVELCGDAHLGNFRWYRAPSGDLVFDLNDFDETLPGPFEWDVKRLAASIVVCARTGGMAAREVRDAARTALREYRKAIAVASTLSPLDLYYYRFSAKAVLERVEEYGKDHRKWKEGVLEKATRRNSLLAFDKLTEVVEGRRMIVADPPLVMLGWMRWHESSRAGGIDFYLRQLWDGKGKIDIETLGPERLAAYAGLCGKTLAFAHARSGDAMAIRGYIGDDKSFDEVIFAYAERYAQVTARDHAQLREAIEDGVIEAVCDI